MSDHDSTHTKEITNRIRALHRPADADSFISARPIRECRRCREPYPCTEIRLLDLIDKAAGVQ